MTTAHTFCGLYKGVKGEAKDMHVGRDVDRAQGLIIRKVTVLDKKRPIMVDGRSQALVRVPIEDIEG